MSSHSEQRMRRRTLKSGRRAAAAKPQAQAPKRESEEPGIMGQIGSAVMGGLRRVDDSTQAFARDHLLQLPKDGTILQDGSTLQGPRNFLGNLVFAARKDYEGDNTAYRGTGTMNYNIGLGASRALQGGAITAAGYGLAQLTNSFGSQADYQEPNQLSL